MVVGGGGRAGVTDAVKVKFGRDGLGLYAQYDECHHQKRDQRPKENSRGKLHVLSQGYLLLLALPVELYRTYQYSHGPS